MSSMAGRESCELAGALLALLEGFHSWDKQCSIFRRRLSKP